MRSPSIKRSGCAGSLAKRHLRRIIPVTIAIISALIPHRTFAYSYYETGLEYLGSTSALYSLELKHYSGGYWMVQNGPSGQIKIYDSQLGEAGICGFLNATQYASWTVPLPYAASNAAAQGRKILANIKSDTDRYSGAYSSAVSNGRVTVCARPIFHVSTAATLNSFVRGIRVTIPLVSSGYGRNTYSIYGLNCYGLPGYGAFSERQPEQVYSPFIHPSQIANSLGWFKSGSTINIRGSAISSVGHTIGLLTLANGGAVGLQFDFPITVDFYEETVTLVHSEDKNDDWDNGTSNADEQPASSQTSAPERVKTGPEPVNTPPDPGTGNAPEEPDPPAFDPYTFDIHRKY